MTSTKNQFDPIIQTLSVRAKNCCEAEGIHTIEELAAYATTHDLHKVRNCGLKTVMELKEIINKYAHCTVAPKSEHESLVPPSLRNKVEEIFDNQVLSINDDEIFNVLCGRYSSATVFLDSVLNTPSSILYHFPELNYRQNIYLWNVILDIIFRLSNISVSNPIEAVFKERIRDSYSLCSRWLKKESNKLLFEFLPKDLLLVVENEYVKCIDRLSTRAQNYLRKTHSSYFTILDFLEGLETDKSNGKGCGVGTITDINQAFKDYKEFIIELIDTPKQDIEYLVTKNEFPFLNTKQVANVVAYKEQEDRIPFFYVVFNYFCNSKDREAIMFDRYNGITTPSENLSYIAASFNLTRERVRQIIIKYRPTKILRFTQPPSPEQYPFLSEDIIDVNKCFAEILETEFAGEQINFTSDSFVGIAQLFTNYSLYDFNGTKYLFSQKMHQSFDFNNAWVDISKTFNSKTTEDVSIPISFFISNYILTNEIDYCIIRDFILQLIVNNFEVEVDENYNVILQKNFINIEDELFKIIEQAGKPISFDDILAEFYLSHPEYSYKSPGTIRLILLNSHRIKSVGKTSSFSLAQWNFSTLTVRGLIAAILQESDVPLSLDTLVEILESKGRKTNKNSVNSSILSDTKNDFVKFKGGLIGIGSKTYDPTYEVQDPESIARKSFSERLKDYIEFIDVNFHVPFLTQDETEASLYRWYRNVEKGTIDVSPQQKEQLKRELSKRKHYIMTKSEYAFSQRCVDFKYYVSTEFELPTQKSDSSLYMWFLKARKESENLSPKNSDAYNDLIDFLVQYGFTFE